MVDQPIKEYLTDTLKAYDVNTVFGIVGIPIVELAETMIERGIKFIGCRNEQAASYAASAYGYLTGKPGVLLVVGGPGVIHALAGIYNSMSNRWPLVVIAGSSEDSLKGGFQELDQISLLNRYVKFSGRIKQEQSLIDTVLYNAFKNATLGTPGVTYIDVPGNYIEGSLNLKKPSSMQPLVSVKSSADPAIITKVADLLSNNSDKQILVVIGKGAVNSSLEVRELIDTFNLPFLPTPMAKGIVPDSHPLNVSSARSQVLKDSEIVVVLGARLNWILHFAEAPKWNSNSRFIQVDSDPETIGQNNQRGLEYGLLGDIGLVTNQLIYALKEKNFNYSGVTANWREIIVRNQYKLHLKETAPTNGKKLNYNQVYHTLRQLIDDSKTIIVAEGANTMDVARISFPTDRPKQRLDAGTNATMGVGLGYGLASKIAQPRKDVIIVQGDSAFGFSAMEIETAVRYKVALIIVVMNNSGIYHGIDSAKKGKRLSSTTLSQECRYDLVANGLGANGFLVRNLTELKVAFEHALKNSRNKSQTSVLNVVIEPGKQSKLSFGWQNKRENHL